MARSFHLALALTCFGSAFGASPARASTFFAVTNLVTDDQTANTAQISDPALVNPWGIASSPTSPFWISDNGSGVSTIYSVDPTTSATSKANLTVAIPGAGSVTGQVFNPANATGQFNGNLFLFVSEDGTISGWRNALGSQAEVLATGSSANVYKGVALGTLSGNSYLYAANFKSGGIDVLAGQSGAPALLGSFLDPNLPSGYAPFDIANLGGVLYVTYAVQGAGGIDDVPGAGHGIVDRFDLQGNLLGRLATGGSLNSPWGLAIAPASFGAFAGDLLVGNFGDGSIAAYDKVTGTFVGLLRDGNGNPLAIDGLWGLSPGNDGSGGSSDAIYFTAGPGNESHGLFGVITVLPEPGLPALLAGALVPLALARRRRGL
jgi:uncharacterized protein (TIGR03118 family)